MKKIGVLHTTADVCALNKNVCSCISMYTKQMYVHRLDIALYEYNYPLRYSVK